jgi:hypothetical protein
VVVERSRESRRGLASLHWIRAPLKCVHAPGAAAFSSGFDFLSKELWPCRTKSGLRAAKSESGQNQQAGRTQDGEIITTASPGNRGAEEETCKLLIYLVASSGIEPELSALRGRRVNQLHHDATDDDWKHEDSAPEIAV